MCKFTEQELKEIFRMLERAGMNPMWCDTPVPYYDVNIPAGVPTDVGEVMQGEYLMLPKALVGMDPTMVLNVRGDSMKDAGISSGDRMEVRFTPDARDGDIVVAEVDGQCTVKTLFTDEQGDHWLVPSNEAYDAIRLTEEMQVRIVGVVKGIVKDLPRTSFNTCVKSVRRTCGKLGDKAPSLAKTERTIVRMATEVKHARQWYAVYRALVDRRALEDGAYTDFCDMVARLTPEHDHLPSASELRRLAVQSFCKSPSLWDKSNAPVSGSRFDDYLRIARSTMEALRI